MTLWAHDRSLALALDVARALSKPVEYLMALWPCAGEVYETLLVVVVVVRGMGSAYVLWIVLLQNNAVDGRNSRIN